MQFTKKQKIITSVVVIIVLLAIYIAFDKRLQNQKTVTDTSTQTATTTNSGTQIITHGTGGYTVEQVPITEGKGVPQPIPDLNRVSVSANGTNINLDAKTVADARIKELQTQLKADPKNLSAWTDLGIYQKMAGDYIGASISWKYASRLSPTDFVSLGNLGNLYAYFLNDKDQAESYYKQAIINGPTQAYLYTQLAEVYRDIFKDAAKARAIVTQGLLKISNDPNLLQLQSSL